jgi:Tfp pilus assembly protein PilF
VCLLAALSFRQTSSWRDNAALFDRALSVNPRSLMAHHNSGAVLAREGKHGEAVRWYRRGLKYHPRCVELYRGLGISLVALGEVDEGLALWRLDAAQPIDALQAALRLDPESVEAHLQLGLVLNEQGRREEAAAAFREALSRIPPESELAGRIRKRLGPVENRENTRDP